MIEEKEILNKIYKISPEFQKYLKNQLDYMEDERLCHVDLGCYARYLLEKFKKKEFIEFKNAFKILEEILNTGNDKIKNCISLGFYETFQNIALGEKMDLNIFNEYLLPNSKKEWDEIIKSWS